MEKHGERGPLVGRTVALGLCLALMPGGALAACRLALLLALDVSSSVDAIEDRLQREGLAKALVSAPVAAALLERPGAPVGLAVYEWSGRYRQTVVLPWQMIESENDLATAAADIAASPRSTDQFPTALGYALGYAAGMFRNGPDCLTRKLDVSGDGVTNEGFGPALAYANFPLEGVTVNGLVIGSEAAVMDHYRTDVIRGPGAFAMAADSYADYEDAMRRKLLREIGTQVLGRVSTGPAD